MVHGTMRIGLMTFALVLSSVPSFADITCVTQIPKATEQPQTGMVVGTVVGIVAGAYASDGDISIIMTSADLGCDAGSAVGKVWAQADNAAMILNGKMYGLIHTAPQQGILRYLGVANEPVPPKPPEGMKVYSLDAGYNLVVLPLGDKALKQLGVSDQDRQNIETLAAPPSPANVQQQVDTVKRIFGIK